MGQEDLGPESATVPSPPYYSPIFALLLRREKTVIAYLQKRVRVRELAGRVSVALLYPSVQTSQMT